MIRRKERACWIACVVVMFMVLVVAMQPSQPSQPEPEPVQQEPDRKDVAPGCCQRLGILQAGIVEAMNLSIREDRKRAREVVQETLAAAGFVCRYRESQTNTHPFFECR